MSSRTINNEQIDCPYYNTTGCARSKDCIFNSEYFCKCVIYNSEVENGQITDDILRSGGIMKRLWC